MKKVKCPAEQKKYVEEYRANLISSRRMRYAESCASNGYHYLGCAKTMAQIGKAFAESLLEMEKN